MTFPRGKPLIGPAVGAAAAIAVLWALGVLDVGGDAPVYREVVVDSGAIVSREPTVDVGLVESIARPRAEASVRATAPGAAAGDVAAFCSAAGYVHASDPIRSDMIASAPGPAQPGDAGGAPPGAPAPAPEVARRPAPAPARVEPAAETPTPTSGLPLALRPRPPAVSLLRSGVVSWRSTELWSVSSTGDLRHVAYRTWPPVSFRVDGDSIVVQSARFGWLHVLGPLALCAAGGVAAVEVDSWTPVAAGCGIGAYWILR